MSVGHESIEMNLSTGREFVFLLEGPHIPYMGSVYGVFSSWELLVEHTECGANVAIGMISERMLNTAARRIGRKHAALLGCTFTLPEC